MAYSRIVSKFAPLLFLFVGNIEALAQPINEQQMKIIQDNAAFICNSVKELRGSKSEAQIEGDIKAKLKGLAGKLADAGVSGKVSGKFEDSEGLSQEATAAALEGDRGCRERVFNKMFDRFFGSTKKDTGDDRPFPKISVLGIWEGTVTCRDNRKFFLTIEFVQEIGDSTIGFSNWTGPTSGSDRTTLKPNPSAQDRSSYSLISDRRDVFKYILQIPTRNLIRGISTGDERCNIYLIRV